MFEATRLMPQSGRIIELLPDGISCQVLVLRPVFALSTAYSCYRHYDCSSRRLRTQIDGYLPQAYLGTDRGHLQVGMCYQTGMKRNICGWSGALALTCLSTSQVAHVMNPDSFVSISCLHQSIGYSESKKGEGTSKNGCLGVLLFTLLHRTARIRKHKTSGLSPDHCFNIR